MVNEMAFASVFALKSKSWQNINGLPEGSSSVFFFYFHNFYRGTGASEKEMKNSSPECY